MEGPSPPVVSRFKSSLQLFLWPTPRAKPLNPLPTPTGGHKKLESQQRVANKVMQLPKPSGKVGSWKWTMGMGMGDGVMAMFHAPCSMLHVPPVQEYGHPKYD